MLKEEFKDIELHDGGGLNLMVIRDTQSSRKIDYRGYRGVFFLTFGFKDGMCGFSRVAMPNNKKPFCRE
jgi:hypothetical protein